MNWEQLYLMRYTTCVTQNVERCGKTVFHYSIPVFHSLYCLQHFLILLNLLHGSHKREIELHMLFTQNLGQFHWVSMLHRYLQDLSSNYSLVITKN